ncbi:hypothetical protein X975_22479, partial [Stegodyphus mimosarum]
MYFAYSFNRICHKGQDRNPFELYTKRKPSMRHLKAFGTIACVGIPKAKRNSKLDTKATKGK